MGQKLNAQHLDNIYLEAERAFNQFDENRNGKISKEEVKHAYKKANIKPNDETIELIFKKFDTNFDSELDFSEFLNLLETQVFVQFANLDINNDGEISKQELRAKAGSRLTDEQISTIFNKLDFNHNNRIDFLEFVFTAFATISDLLAK